MEQIIGTYKLERNECLDEFYEDIGMVWVQRQLMCLEEPTIQITKGEDEQWTFKTVYAQKILEKSFKLGEEYEDMLPTGKLLKSITTLEGNNKLVSKCKMVEDPTFTIGKQCEFSEDGMIMTLQASSRMTVAKRYFRRIPCTATSD